jgi:DUF1365 family protein
MTSAIYRGLVTHHRSGGVEHRFVHRLPWFLFDLEELENLSMGCLFTINRLGIVSFHDKDHGARDGTSYRQWLNHLLAQQGLRNLRYKVICMPRIFGYVFNPISIVYCYKHDDDSTLAAVLYEVHNTFGESYAYVQKRDGHDIPTTKQLHVSPFFSMTGHYEFTVTEPDQDLNVAISYFDDEGSSLFAGFKGTGIPFTAPNLAKTIVQAPLATLGITLDIHWQAFRLWLKGLRVYHKPKQQDVQHG